MDISPELMGKALAKLCCHIDSYNGLCRMSQAQVQIDEEFVMDALTELLGSRERAEAARLAGITVRDGPAEEV